MLLSILPNCSFVESRQCNGKRKKNEKKVEMQPRNVKINESPWPLSRNKFGGPGEVSPVPFPLSVGLTIAHIPALFPVSLCTPCKAKVCDKGGSNRMSERSSSGQVAAVLLSSYFCMFYGELHLIFGNPECFSLFSPRSPCQVCVCTCVCVKGSRTMWLRETNFLV